MTEMELAKSGAESLEYELGWSSRLCIFLQRTSHWYSIHGLSWFGKIVCLFNRVLTGADIDRGAVISKSVRIPHTIGLVIGETAIVEDGVTIMPHVVLGSRRATLEKRRHPHVRSGAFIGAGAKLLGPITIGRNAKIAANAVVLEDIPDSATAIGVPARIVPGMT